MRVRMLPAAALAVALTVSGCAGDRPNEGAGMVIGGALGGLLGSQAGRHHDNVTAIIVGTLAGAAIGGAVGRSMDQTDRLRTAAALENVRTGVPTSWQNPDTGNEFTVTPTRTYDSGGTPCREYTMDALIGGKTQKVYGTACRQADGSWKIES